MQPPQHEFLQIARVGHRIWRGQHARRLRMGDKQRRAAAEAAADVAGVGKKIASNITGTKSNQTHPPS